MRFSPSLIASTLSLALVAASFGDVVNLKDGTKVEGEIKKTEDGYNVTTPDGRVRKVTLGQVQSIELKPATTQDDVEKRLESLRRSTANLSDAKVVIGRYKEFIKKYAGSPSADEATKELAEWQERLDKKMTRAGDKWVTPQELGAIQEESLASAIHARRLIKQGRLKEATPALDEALKLDPKNASALYLRGILLYRQDQVALARKAFEAVPPLVPNHGPTLNNIGVLQWKQDQQLAALTFYDQAMVSMPRNPIILNNVAEALNGLKDSYRDHATTKKLLKHFNEQDEALADEMSKQGKYRWGATWVSGEELDRLQAKEKQIKEKIEKLDEDYQTAQNQIEQIDSEIADTNRSIRRLDADTYRRGADGRMFKAPYPRLYYDLQRDLQELNAQRIEQQGVMQRIKKDAKRIQQEIPIPRYTGNQKTFDVDMTPLIPHNDPGDKTAVADEKKDAPPAITNPKKAPKKVEVPEGDGQILPADLGDREDPAPPDPQGARSDEPAAGGRPILEAPDLRDGQVLR